MESPFPGMDPYLEAPALWSEFQHTLMGACFQYLMPSVFDRYRMVLRKRDAHQDYLEIQRRSDNRLVTVLYVLGPTDKTTEGGRQAYVQHWRDASEANRIEIDLLLQGIPTLHFSRRSLPEWDYAVTVTRAVKPERYEIYTSNIDKRLPRFRVPLASDDGDAVLDLQAVVTRCYDTGRFFERINYDHDPAVPLKKEARSRLDAILLTQKLRMPHDHVALAAYYIWEREGRPTGREKEHWHQALQALRTASMEGRSSGKE
jgi:hypothetical protein